MKCNGRLNDGRPCSLEGTVLGLCLYHYWRAREAGEIESDGRLGVDKNG